MHPFNVKKYYKLVKGGFLGDKKHLIIRLLDKINLSYKMKSSKERG